MGFAWTTNVAVDDPIEGWPSGFGDVRELRYVADMLKNNMCLNDYTAALVGENIGEQVGEDSGENVGEDTGENFGEDTGENVGANTGEDSGENVGANTGEDNVYLDHDSPEDTGDNYSEHADQTLNLGTDRDSNQTSEKANADNSANGWYS